MKKVLFGILAVLLVAVIAAPASAITLSQGNILIQIDDVSSLWTTEFGALAPRLPNWSGPVAGFVPDGAQIGDESRAILNVNIIDYQGPQPDVNPADGQLAGLVYGLKIKTFVIAGSLAIITFEGGTVKIYEDNTPEGPSQEHIFNPSPGTPAPLLWAADNTYLNINDAGDDSTLWLEADFVPNAPDGTTLTTVIDLVNGSGSTFGGFLDIVGGSAENSFVKDIGVVAGTGLTYDLDFGGTTSSAPNATYFGTFADEGLWQLASADAIRGAIIPEPATMALFGLGLVGLGAYRRKRK